MNSVRSGEQYQVSTIPNGLGWVNSNGFGMRCIGLPQVGLCIVVGSIVLGSAQHLAKPKGHLGHAVGLAWCGLSHT